MNIKIMSLKFEKNRSVSLGYCKIPLFYTNIKHPNNPDKELVIMDIIGNSYTICWRNNQLCKVGIEKLVKGTDKGFIYKGKEIELSKCNKVF